jgi:oxygen-independent coproporphyrinogen-3 oxidase
VEGAAEITLEANPGTIDLAKAAALRGARFNRISLGVQSLDDRRLRKIGRIHTSQEALDAYQAVRQAGFANVSIDLIFALPTQTLAEWQNTLNRAVQLNPEHASLYELSIEEGAKFAEAYKAGLLIMPDEDTRLEMYESAIAALTGEGYEHYEVSNFAKPGFRSRHNQVYWKNESYFGFGAGAVRYLDGVRCTMTTSVEDYISRIQQGLDPADSCEELTGSALMGETIMLGLRTSDGVDLRAFEERFSTSLIEAYDEVLPVLYNDRLIDLTDTHLRLTHKGLLMADRVAAEFIV